MKTITSIFDMMHYNNSFRGIKLCHSTVSLLWISKWIFDMIHYVNQLYEEKYMEFWKIYQSSQSVIQSRYVNKN